MASHHQEDLRRRNTIAMAQIIIDGCAMSFKKRTEADVAAMTGRLEDLFDVTSHYAEYNLSEAINLAINGLRVLDRITD